MAMLSAAVSCLGYAISAIATKYYYITEDQEIESDDPVTVISTQKNTELEVLRNLLVGEGLWDSPWILDDSVFKGHNIVTREESFSDEIPFPRIIVEEKDGVIIDVLDRCDR